MLSSTCVEKKCAAPEVLVTTLIGRGGGVSSVSLGEDVLHRVEGPGGLAFETRRLSGI